MDDQPDSTDGPNLSLANELWCQALIASDEIQVM